MSKPAKKPRRRVSPPPPARRSSLWLDLASTPAYCDSPRLRTQVW